VARYLTTIPDNSGFYNLGTVQSYPTGGTGPTAYGPTSYFGSDPLPATLGDSINNPVDLGDFTAVFRTIPISNSHGGLTRRQSSFFKLKLNRQRSIQLTQNFSQFAYTSNTNRNTLVAFYKVEENNKCRELPINDSGYVYKSTGVDYDSTDADTADYPNTSLDPGSYIFVITNDIRYLETTYSINVTASVTEWGLIGEAVEESIDFGLVAVGVEAIIDFGGLSG
jgi:hypothetical protein